MNPNILGFATDITHEKILYLVNLERQKGGLDPLSYSIELATAASQKAQDMFLKNYWAHISPTGQLPGNLLCVTVTSIFMPVRTWLKVLILQRKRWLPG